MAFDQYAGLLIDWQSRMNLVARSTLEQTWQRHFADSAQLVELAPKMPMRWLDMGSGAGFPGLVVALLSDHRVTLVEATAKKCRFLEAVVTQLGLTNVTILNRRIEAVARSRFDIISARACAPLQTLFELGGPLANDEASWMLLKGETVDREIEEARHRFDYSAELIPSRTDPRGRIVVASRVRPRITDR